MALKMVYALSASGLGIARTLADRLGVPVHGRMAEADLVVDSTADYLRQQYSGGHAFVFVGALGALVRMLAPVVSEKQREPPVIAVSDDGGVVIPVLGGHRGGNELARRIGAILQVRPAITTASDIRFGVALDDPPRGWHLAGESDYRGFMSRLLKGDSVRLDGAPDWLDPALFPTSGNPVLTIRGTERAVPAQPDQLVFHPERLAIGVGCIRDADPQLVVSHVRGVLAEAGLAPESVAVVASIAQKMDEAAVHAVGAAFERPVRFFSPQRLEAETPRLANPSSAVFRHVGCHGVAEAAALAAAGEASELIVAKRGNRQATVAVARAGQLIDPGQVGQRRGQLWVAGIGPGAIGWRTTEVAQILAEVDVLVGYSGYLDQVDPTVGFQERHGFALGEERDRVLAAIRHAASGKSVALVCSGDPGIYALASLVFECLEQAENPDWNRIAVEIAPGVSAIQACAARAGAPIGHDFCAVSLSDLLTPRAVIEQRLAAASAGDFVVALYNPASRQRRHLLNRALEILSSDRKPDTPVVIGRQVGRAGETITMTTLAEIDPDVVDMLSIVIVGNAQSRRIGKRMYTPRGYRNGTAR